MRLLEVALTRLTISTSRATRKCDNHAGGASIHDLRLAIRSLRATPVVTMVAIVSLSLGVGANTAIFSLVDRLVLRSLPVRDPARLALVATTAQLSYKPNYSYARFDAIAAHTELFDGVLAVGNWSLSALSSAPAYRSGLHSSPRRCFTGCSPVTQRRCLAQH